MYIKYHVWANLDIDLVIILINITFSDSGSSNIVFEVWMLLID